MRPIRRGRPVTICVARPQRCVHVFAARSTLFANTWAVPLSLPLRVPVCPSVHVCVASDPSPSLESTSKRSAGSAESKGNALIATAGRGGEGEGSNGAALTNRGWLRYDGRLSGACGEATKRERYHSGRAAKGTDERTPGTVWLLMHTHTVSNAVTPSAHAPSSPSSSASIVRSLCVMFISSLCLRSCVPLVQPPHRLSFPVAFHRWSCPPPPAIRHASRSVCPVPSFLVHCPHPPLTPVLRMRQ